MFFLEPADWIGVILIVLGLALVSAAVFVHMRKGSNNPKFSTTLHPSLAKELSEDNDDPITSSYVEDNGQSITRSDVEDATADSNQTVSTSSGQVATESEVVKPVAVTPPINPAPPAAT